MDCVRENHEVGPPPESGGQTESRSRHEPSPSGLQTPCRHTNALEPMVGASSSTKSTVLPCIASPAARAEHPTDQATVPTQLRLELHATSCPLAEQIQLKGPEPLTPLGVPKPQSPLEGASTVLPPLAGPHVGGVRTQLPEALQLPPGQGVPDATGGKPHDPAEHWSSVHALPSLHAVHPVCCVSLPVTVYVQLVPLHV